MCNAYLFDVDPSIHYFILDKLSMPDVFLAFYFRQIRIHLYKKAI